MRGNKEIRFRADPYIHELAEKLKLELGFTDKSAGLKLLIKLGDNKVKDVIKYLDDITHPLNDRQFENIFTVIKTNLKIIRNERKKPIN